jgi:cell division protein ZapB
MISEFQDLSDKIDRLAQLAQSLRSENYLLRQANSLLSAENVDFKHRLIEAQRRVPNPSPTTAPTLTRRPTTLPPTLTSTRLADDPT